MMEVQYKTIEVTKQDNSSIEYKKYKLLIPDLFSKDYLGTWFCCDKMKGFWKSRTVSLLSTIDIPNVGLCLYEEKWDEYEIEEYPISFCPFCGEKIILKETKRVKLVAIEKEVTETKKITEYKEVEEVLLR